MANLANATVGGVGDSHLRNALPDLYRELGYPAIFHRAAGGRKIQDLFPISNELVFGEDTPTLDLAICWLGGNDLDSQHDLEPGYKLLEFVAECENRGIRTFVVGQLEHRFYPWNTTTEIFKKRAKKLNKFLWKRLGRQFIRLPGGLDSRNAYNNSGVHLKPYFYRQVAAHVAREILARLA